ncbi:flagellar biosynthesis anti-sigma factor FlgM [Planktomarina temperata]|jgi:flagellar biosynthesis anti-sigma factor FlgM|nr:flagellar biosynthesis anti-sigma factor FlgM [Planktomarina temperata]MDA9254932.1 flagellar biosynthesis anti-sigma factor FlgM [Planktomarina temperata]MDB2452946.1 flagellar biosynthesis anti-sigma factor FlgM [Planktomarina temperata]MDB2508307.1 flagellar biosynthesis anti-sigma factor FlgM [Planktomarina temperata]MDB4854286.1 flagellar biosynthesis anti-sigma factor FlgM [Planktomarina temperata]
MMINSVGNNVNTASVQLGDSNKVNIQPDKKISDLAPKEIVNKLDSQDLKIKEQVAKLADGPPVDRSLVNEIKTKVEQGRYPIDLDIVTAKMFESFQEAGS